MDASIIEAPSSTKNRRRARDPEMHQTKKGNEWRFGMKLHIGVDADSGLVHSMRATAANVADVTEAHRLLHGEEREAYGDAGYQGVEKRPEQAGSEVEWRVALRPGLRRLLEPGSEAARAERAKASLRAKVEHPFLAVKRRFGYDKVRYRGLAKNRERLALLLGLTNLLQSRAPTRLTRGDVRPPRPSKRDGRANVAPDLPRPPPLPSSLSNTTCRRQQIAAGSLLAQRIPRDGLNRWRVGRGAHRSACRAALWGPIRRSGGWPCLHVAPEALRRAIPGRTAPVITRAEAPLAAGS